MKYLCIGLLVLVVLQFETIKQLNAKCDKPAVYNVTNGRER